MTPLPRRRPWQVACETVALDHLSNGRLIFGAGLGVDERDFAAFGEEADPKIRAEKLDEGLEVLNGLWTGESFHFHGKHYQVDHVKLLPKPVQSPRIPIWIAGGWPRRKPFRRAARWDGAYIMRRNQMTDEILTPEDIREIAAYIKTHRERTDPFDVAFASETPSDRKQAAEMVQMYIQAGVTWWLELSQDTFEETRQRIRNGPPRT